MLKLYGFPLSNYFNMVKIVLLEKGIDFEYVPCKPSQEEDYLGKSPMGKIPCIETEHGFLSETSAILDYIEDLSEQPAFYPADAFQRARVKEMIKQIELYVELPGRTCYAEAFFGGTVSDEVKATALANMQKGLASIKRKADISPYLLGADITYADFFFMYTMELALSVGKRVFKTDLLAGFSQARDLLEKLNDRDSAQQILADKKA